MHRFFRAVVPSILLALCVGQIYAFTLFSDSIMQSLSTYDHFVSKAQVQFAFSLSIFFLGVGAAVLGSFVERHIRFSAFVGTTLFVTGLGLTELGILCKSITLIYVGYGFLVGVGTGTIYIAPVKTMMLWFPRHKAMAAALPITAFGLGSTVSAILSARYNVATGHTFAWFALVYAVPMYLSCALIRRPSTGHASKNEFNCITLFSDERFIRLWVFMFINIFCGLCMIPLAKDLMISGTVNYSERTISAIILLSGVTNALGRLLFAWWTERLANRLNILLVIIAIPFAVMTLSFLPVTTGLVLLTVNACYGAGFSVIPAAIEAIYGIDNLSKVHGIILSAWGVAGLVSNQIAVLVSDGLGFGNLGIIAVITTLYALNYINVDALKHHVFRRSEHRPA